MKLLKKHLIEDYQSIAQTLKERLVLETGIVALKFIKKKTEIPEGFSRPLKDRGRKMTICMAMAEARYEGAKLAVCADDNPCTPVSVVHGWVKIPMWSLIKSQVENMWQKNALSMMRGHNSRFKLGGFAAQYPFSRILGHRGVLVSPLSDTPFVPDTVVIYGYPEQMTHIAHALGYEGRYVPRAVLTGFAESCYAAGLIPMKSKKPTFVLLGMGERSVGRAKKYEAAIGMPGWMTFIIDRDLFKAGGEHNLKTNLENPISPDQVDESLLPGWANVRNLIQRQ